MHDALRAAEAVTHRCVVACDAHARCRDAVVRALPRLVATVTTRCPALDEPERLERVAAPLKTAILRARVDDRPVADVACAARFARRAALPAAPLRCAREPRRAPAIRTTELTVQAAAHALAVAADVRRTSTRTRLATGFEAAAARRTRPVRAKALVGSTRVATRPAVGGGRQVHAAAIAGREALGADARSEATLFESLTDRPAGTAVKRVTREVDTSDTITRGLRRAARGVVGEHCRFTPCDEQDHENERAHQHPHR